MGDRGNIIIKTQGNPDLYLYTHWYGSELSNILKRALAKRWRWNDSAFLARIIFCEMVMGYEHNETGFGISTFATDTGTELVVDVNKQTVNGTPFEKFVA